MPMVMANFCRPRALDKTKFHRVSALPQPCMFHLNSQVQKRKSSPQK